MYSAVLMLALTAGSETADFGRHRCHGADACAPAACAPVAYTCSSSYGCAGGCHERHRLFGGHRNGCNESYSGCSASYGCSGGGLFSRHHHGCTSGSYGCSGAYYGCTTGGGYGCTSGPVGMPPKMEKKEMPKGEPLPKPKGETRNAAPATIIVSLPAGARLTVDGAPTNSTTERRTLVTPELEVGSTYLYTMRAEIVRDGQTVVQTQEVNVRGGETSTVQFQFPQGVASR